MNTLPISLFSRPEYEQFIYGLIEQYPSIRFSTLTLVPPGMNMAQVNGLIGFGQDIVLCVHEWINFARGFVVRYGYQVSRAPQPFAQAPLPDASEYCPIGYPHKQVLYWYDSWPHPHDAALASTHPHHKHIHPNIKHNRLPAPGLSFMHPNLPMLIQEIERDLLAGGVQVTPCRCLSFVPKRPRPGWRLGPAKSLRFDNGARRQGSPPRTPGRDSM